METYGVWTLNPDEERVKKNAGVARFQVKQTVKFGKARCARLSAQRVYSWVLATNGAQIRAGVSLVK